MTKTKTAVADASLSERLASVTALPDGNERR